MTPNEAAQRTPQKCLDVEKIRSFLFTATNRDVQEFLHLIRGPCANPSDDFAIELASIALKIQIAAEQTNTADRMEKYTDRLVKQTDALVRFTKVLTWFTLILVVIGIIQIWVSVAQIEKSQSSTGDNQSHHSHDEKQPPVNNKSCQETS